MSFTELSLIRILIVIGATIAIVISAYLFFVHNQKFYKKNKNLSHHLRPKWLQIIFLSSSLLILFLTLLGPKGGTQTENVSYDGIDMIIALDVSQSMNVADITVENKITTRLLAAKQLLKEFVTDHPQDRFGLTVFAGDATSICPLTQDHEILLTFMDGVDHNNATSQGTNLLAALSLAMERFRDPERSKAIVLISDGGDDPFTDSLHEIKSYREENNITLATIGIGTDKGGHIIEGQDRFGRVQYKTYKWQRITSTLNDKNLKAITKKLNGEYTTFTDLNNLDKLSRHLNTLQKKAIKSNATNQQDLTKRFALVSFLFFSGFLVLFVREKIGK